MRHLVEHEKYCKTCKHYGVKETEDPCNDCLTWPENEDSRKPTLYEEEKNDGSNRSGRRILPNENRIR